MNFTSFFGSAVPPNAPITTENVEHLITLNDDFLQSICSSPANSISTQDETQSEFSTKPIDQATNNTPENDDMNIIHHVNNAQFNNEPKDSTTSFDDNNNLEDNNNQDNSVIDNDIQYDDEDDDDATFDIISIPDSGYDEHNTSLSVNYNDDVCEGGENNKTDDNQQLHKSDEDDENDASQTYIEHDIVIQDSYIPHLIGDDNSKTNNNDTENNNGKTQDEEIPLNNGLIPQPVVDNLQGDINNVVVVSTMVDAVIEEINNLTLSSSQTLSSISQQEEQKQEEQQDHIALLDQLQPQQNVQDEKEEEDEKEQQKDKVNTTSSSHDDNEDMNSINNYSSPDGTIERYTSAMSSWLPTFALPTAHLFAQGQVQKQLDNSNIINTNITTNIDTISSGDYHINDDNHYQQQNISQSLVDDEAEYQFIDITTSLCDLNMNNKNMNKEQSNTKMLLTSPKNR
eukprot:UN04526